MTTPATPDPLLLWQTLVDDHAELIALAASVDRTSVSGIARLRKNADAHLAHLAAQLAEARARSIAKLGPDFAASVIADIEGVEQASSLAVARLKAQRFKDAGLIDTIDLCSGIGVDALALIEAGHDVLAVDHDPIRAWMTERNARCTSLAADAVSVDPTGKALHIDPARRAGGQRTQTLADTEPVPEVVAGLLRRAKAACLKLSPAVDMHEAEQAFAEASDAAGGWSVEFVSEGGRLVQTLWWTGGLAAEQGSRTATRIDDGGIHHLTDEDIYPAIGPVPEAGCLHTLDPAAERAELAMTLCARHDAVMPHPRAGLLATEEPIDSPWLTAFRVEAEMGWREDNVRKWLAEHRTAHVEVKPRGLRLDTDALQIALRGPKSLRKKGTGTDRTVFVTRLGEKIRCWIAQRL